MDIECYKECLSLELSLMSGENIKLANTAVLKWLYGTIMLRYEYFFIGNGFVTLKIRDIPTPLINRLLRDLDVYIKRYAKR